MAKTYGGKMTLELPPGKKLINITWKDAELWYLVRDRKQGEPMETYEFKEDSRYGLYEGVITVKEK
jgi:hypothetical protein